MVILSFILVCVYEGAYKNMREWPKAQLRQRMTSDSWIFKRRNKKDLKFD